jgi:type IV secretion system protein VirD4
MNKTEPSIARTRAINAFYMLVLIVTINSICTQFVANRLDYHPALGSPLYDRLYSPFDWWGWMFHFYSYAPDTYGHALLIFVIGAAGAILSDALISGFKSRSPRKHEGTHGTAHFATPEEVWETGLLHDTAKSSSGVYCGGYYNEKTGRTLYLRHNGPEHICVIAPTRSGKGVGLVVPTLLSWPESVLILDRKGENYAMTAGWRQKYAKNVILRFDPAEPGISCCWNPLGEIRFGTRYQVSDAQNIALMVIDDDGKGIQGNHFRSAAFELLVGLILHALYKSPTVGREPSLQDCAHMLTGVGSFATPDNRERALDESDPRALSALFFEMRDVSLEETDAAREAQLAIRGAGQRFSDTPSRELGSIISTANNALSLYRDPIVGENTSRSDFKIADLMDYEDPVSLYFITTPRNADRMKPLARLLLTQIVLGLADRMEFDKGRSKTAHKHRLLLMLDEFPTLGKLDVFEGALAYIAGYGMKAYIITQDVQQLYKAYSNYESIISNCHIRIAYAPNKLETAEWLSKMTGQTTIINEHVSVSGKRFGLLPGQFSTHFNSSQRPLMTSDEIMRLPGPKKDANGDILEPGEMLVFVAGQPVIRGKQILYFLDPIFAGRSKIAPPKVSDVICEEPLKFMII